MAGGDAVTSERIKQIVLDLVDEGAPRNYLEAALNKLINTAKLEQAKDDLKVVMKEGGGHA